MTSLGKSGGFSAKPSLTLPSWKKLFFVYLAIVYLMFFTVGFSGCSLLKSLGPGQPQNPPSGETTLETLPEALSKDTLRVHFIDVGQGDSILIEFPGGEKMLIDAGPESSWPSLFGYLKKFGVKRLDWVLFTHPHEDHIGGGAKLVESMDVGKIYMAKSGHTTDTYENLLNAIDKKGLKITEAKAGMAIGPVPDGESSARTLTMKIIGPVKSYKDLNNSSIVAVLSFDGASFLFMGDAESQAEEDMLNAGVISKAQVLKAGHHGSDSSTKASFLAKVKPSYAVISVGKGNDYHHPSGVVLARLKKSDVQVYRTDVSGSIVMTVKDGKIKVFPQHP